MSQVQELLGTFETELKRGGLTLVVLSRLHKAQYGYSLLAEIAQAGIEIEAGTLYPLLRRLEKQGVLTSDWDTSESRPRKYYVLSETGRELYTCLSDVWKKQTQAMQAMIGGEDHGLD